MCGGHCCRSARQQLGCCWFCCSWHCVAGASRGVAEKAIAIAGARRSVNQCQLPFLYIIGLLSYVIILSIVH